MRCIRPWKWAGPQLTRNALMNALHSINNMEVPMLLPGITISISKDYY